MQILLERTGGQVSALQGALANLISVNYQDGYARGYLNDFDVFLSASNVITIETGLIQIKGFRVQNNEQHSESFATLPSQPTKYHLIAILDVRLAAENSTCVFGIQPIRELRKDNIFKHKEGTYEIELASFTATATGIIDLNKTIQSLELADSDISELLKLAKNAMDTAQGVRDDADAGLFNGKSVFVRYSVYPDGRDMTINWSANQIYLGTYIGNSASIYPADYKWMKFIGDVDCIKDVSAKTVDYTLTINTDKTFAAAGITSAKFTIPAGVAHGFYSGVNLASGAFAPALSFVNNSALPLKLRQHSRTITSYAPSANCMILLGFFCDGVNVYCCISEA